LSFQLLACHLVRSQSLEIAVKNGKVPLKRLPQGRFGTLNRKLRPDESAEALKVAGPESYEPTKLDLAWRTLCAVILGSESVSPRQRDRAIHLISLASGLDAVPRFRRSARGRDDKLNALADHVMALGFYLRKLAANEKRATGKRRGHQAVDPEATIAMHVIMRSIHDEISRGDHPKAGRPSMCGEAAARLADQEKITDRDERDYAIEIWAKRANTGALDYKTWKPESYLEAVIAEAVKRGTRMGLKLPSETDPNG